MSGFIKKGRSPINQLMSTQRFIGIFVVLALFAGGVYLATRSSAPAVGGPVTTRISNATTSVPANVATQVLAYSGAAYRKVTQGTNATLYCFESGTSTVISPGG